MAAKVLKFAHDTCDRVIRAAKEYALEESEIRYVRRLRAFGDVDMFEEVKSSVLEYE